eukprot:scaffold170830_cov29-Tisochrysis_lutea.AAC.2
MGKSMGSLCASILPLESLLLTSEIFCRFYDAACPRDCVSGLKLLDCILHPSSNGPAVAWTAAHPWFIKYCAASIAHMHGLVHVPFKNILNPCLPPEFTPIALFHHMALPFPSVQGEAYK